MLSPREPIIHSDSEDSVSASGEALHEQKYNDIRLSRAIRYLMTDGGDDDPAVFITSVDRIDKALVQKLAQERDDFDQKLYKRLAAMVRTAQREFRAAARRDSPVLDGDESDGCESAEERLRSEEGTVSKVPEQPRQPVESRAPEKKRLKHERVFRHCGPHEEAEIWHKNVPPSLPFPDTFRMEHWESLKIDFDLSDAGKKLKADGEFPETNIPFDHPALQQYKNLPRYESGSRFKLPDLSPSCLAAVEELTTVERLVDVVDACNGGYGPNFAGEYVPRVSLEDFKVGNQGMCGRCMGVEQC